MPLIEYPLDISEISRLQSMLQSCAAHGQARFYEISVDSMKILPKTDDVEKFSLYEDFYNSLKTKEIEVKIYNSANTPRNDKHRFIRGYGAEQHKEEKGLNGLDVEQLIAEKLAQKDEQHRVAGIEKELADTKKKLEEAEEYSEKLEERIKELDSKKNFLGNIHLGDITSVALEGLVRRNPQWLAQLPGGEALAGIIEADNKNKETTETPQETAATFKRKDSSEGSPTLSEKEQNYILFLQQLEECFNPEEMAQLQVVLNHLCEHPEKVYSISEYLGLEGEEQESEEENTTAINPNY